MKKIVTIVFIIIATTGLFAQKRSYNIGVLLDNRTEKLEPLFIQLQEQIKAVVGEDAVINFPEKNRLTNKYNLQTAEQNYQTLLGNETDIILAFGVVNNKVLSNRSNYPKPTILFGAVNKDFNGIDLTKKTSGIENFTYLIESESFLDDFKIFKELTGFETLGIVIEKPLVDLLPLDKTFDNLFKQLEADYKLIPFDSVNDITTNLNEIDAVYLAGGFFLTKDEIKQLATVFIEKQLPSFTSLGIDEVQMGIMATNQSDANFEQFLRRIALSVEGYVNGTPLSEMPVYIEYSPRLTINYNTTQQINVPIKYSLIGNTNFIGDGKNVLSEKTYSIIEVINDVLDQNLSLQSQKKDIELSIQDIKTAKSNYLPSLTTSATGTYVDPDSAENSLGQSPEFSTAGNVTLQQTLFSEAANANITIQKNLQKAEQENYNSSQLDLIFDSSNVYFNILILKANVQIQMRNLELTKQNLKIAQQNFEAGQSGKSDVLRFKSQQAQDTQAVVEAINQLEQSFISLNQLLNNPLEMEIDIDDVVLDKGIFEEYNYDQLVNLLDSPTSREPFIDFLTEEAKKNAPELKSLQYNLDAVERNLKLNSGGRFLPTLAVQGQYNSTFSRSGAGSTPPDGFTVLDNNYNVAASISIPIINQNQTNINRQTNIIQKEQLNINKENTQLAIDSNIRTGVLNVINQISNIELSKVSEEAAKESLELTQVSYTSGA
ncbi:TolC family protein, partial [Aquimarina litoralis]|uniref:TolC family protein n=1 Tax=Aquimarina litoralis TaxID=584605 RepID=UPI001C560EEB